MIPKFRAWDKKRSKMFKVNAIRFKHPNGFEPTVLVDEDNGVESTLKLDDCILMQSIGLHDYQGVELYEGDILTDEGGFGHDCWDYGQIEFCEIEHRHYISWKVENICENVTCCSDYLLAGNIYENKELLE